MFFRSQNVFDDTLEDIALNRLFDSQSYFRSILHLNPLGGPHKNRKKWNFFQNKRTFTRKDYM